MGVHRRSPFLISRQPVIIASHETYNANPLNLNSRAGSSDTGDYRMFRPGQNNIQVVTATPCPGGMFVPSAAPNSSVPTSDAPSAIPATAAPAGTITPLPTATRAPNVALAQADAALRNGDYDTAVQTYQAILTRPILSVEPKLRSNASLGLGTAALREGKFDDAVTALNDFIQTYPLDVRLPQAYFLRGDAYLGLSRWTDAIADFQLYLQKRPGLIDSYAYERIGDAYLALSNSDDALNNYNLAVAATRGALPMQTLREKVAASYLNIGKTKEAIAQYDGILSIAKDPDYRAGISLTAANLLLNSGNATAAYERYQQIINTYPNTIQGYRAMQSLLKAGGTIDNLLRGQISFNAGDYNDAINALYA